MTKRTRTFLFFACSIAFLIVTPTVLLYNQGYRLDLSTAQITKTGAFYFGVSPRGSDVFINGQLKKRTDFFFGSALIEELLPGNYLVEIKKEGYFPWKKNLEVKAMAVTEENDVVLFPEKTDFQIFAKGVERFFPSPSGKKALLQKKDSQGQYLTLFDFWPEFSLMNQHLFRSVYQYSLSRLFLLTENRKMRNKAELLLHIPGQ